MSDIWFNFPVFASIASLMWLAAGVWLYVQPQKVTNILSVTLVVFGLGVLAVFVAMLWINLERPPMRTLGETRLWYSLFLPAIGVVVYYRWKYKWFLAYSLALAILFLGINWQHPETYTKVLMPALQSPWFVPHVVVYIFAYALLAASSLVALKGLIAYLSGKPTRHVLLLADNLVYAGYAFLTFGLLFGALWAKEAWGHYWTWDPKETWAFLTWLAYLTYIHFRSYHPQKTKQQLWILSLSFAVLIVCWFGINYLPSAQNSVHVYAN